MKDGGTAFPQPRPDRNTDAEIPGMSLRDYFAAAALTGMIQHWSGPQGMGTPEDYATDAYRIADAMLAAREKR